ncbi:protein of unknown function [Denitratisoma oestradiolicum]|uniref:Uncharacterized protein n=1 Tax=Denitratisoma oestradiolicum TaxID=311182 RepID=A0A6S6XZG1_9PROT|nr:protein of unknown function [Denitratisoma oestradiolicum]
MAYFRQSIIKCDAGRLGIEAGINMNKPIAVARRISAKIGRPSQSALARAWAG